MYLKEAFLVQRESEDDETPQRAFLASEEAHREPAESVVYFRSGILHHNLHQLEGLKTTTLFDGTSNYSATTYEKSHFISSLNVMFKK